MSTNIHIVAKRSIKVISTGLIETQKTSFPVIQTPTKVTYSIMDKPMFEDRINAYKEYVLSNSHDETVDIFDPDDVFGENDPIGSKIYNWGAEHTALLDTWIKDVTEAGYDISFEQW